MSLISALRVCPETSLSRDKSGTTTARSYRLSEAETPPNSFWKEQIASIHSYRRLISFRTVRTLKNPCFEKKYHTFLQLGKLDYWLILSVSIRSFGVGKINSFFFSRILFILITKGRSAITACFFGNFTTVAHKGHAANRKHSCKQKRTCYARALSQRG